MPNAGHAFLDSATGAVPIAKGGTASTTAAAALSALGALSSTASVFGLNTGITAGATQTQAGATGLTAVFNDVTTVTTAGDGVRLPAAAAGTFIVVRNSDSVNSMKVWPASGDDIGAGVDTSRNIPFANCWVFFAINATTWRAHTWSTPV